MGKGLIKKRSSPVETLRICGRGKKREGALSFEQNKKKEGNTVTYGGEG